MRNVQDYKVLLFPKGDFLWNTFILKGSATENCEPFEGWQTEENGAEQENGASKE